MYRILSLDINKQRVEVAYCPSPSEYLDVEILPTLNRCSTEPFENGRGMKAKELHFECSEHGGSAEFAKLRERRQALTAKTLSAKRALDDNLIHDLYRTVSERNIGGFLVSWPGKLGVEAGRTLHLLDYFAEYSLKNTTLKITGPLLTRSRPATLFPRANLDTDGEHVAAIALAHFVNDFLTEKSPSERASVSRSKFQLESYDVDSFADQERLLI